MRSAKGQREFFNIYVISYPKCFTLPGHKRFDTRHYFKTNNKSVSWLKGTEEEVSLGFYSIFIPERVLD